MNLANKMYIIYTNLPCQPEGSHFLVEKNIFDRLGWVNINDNFLFAIPQPLFGINRK